MSAYLTTHARMPARMTRTHVAHGRIALCLPYVALMTVIAAGACRPAAENAPADRSPAPGTSEPSVAPTPLACALTEDSAPVDCLTGAPVHLDPIGLDYRDHAWWPVPTP